VDAFVRRLVAAAAVLTTVTAVASCATVPPCPAKGGRSWRELTTEHFVLRTDLDQDDAVRVLRTLEETRSAMLIGVWPNFEIQAQSTPVFALDSTAELTSYTGPLSSAKHQYAPPFPAFILVPDRGAGTTVKHELAHQLGLQVLAAQPPWFSEGIATFLQTIHPDSQDDARMVIGDADPDLYRLFRYAAPTSLDELLGKMPDSPIERARFYATSWVLVHYLYNHRPEQLRDFERRLGRLQPAPAAFRAAFPDLAQKNHAALIPFLLEGVGGHADLNQGDQIHPTAAGHKIVAENVWRVLALLLKKEGS